MPSDHLAANALAALAAPRERWLSTMAAAVEEVRAYVEAHRPAPDGRHAERARVELGAFAAGRIDAGRFGALFGGADALDPVSLARVERALGELRRAADGGDALFHVRVEPGADPHLAVSRALARAGRAFGAAQVVELTRSGRFRAEEHGNLLDAFPFRRWNRAERQIAPPLVVEADGADVNAGALAEFVDGTIKIVLVLRGATSPAPLARLVTPDVLVMQTGDAADLERAARFAGPAVAALVPDGAARFVHDPSAGAAPHQRLSITFLPAGDALAPVNGTSVFQQQQELALLRQMAMAPTSTTEPGANGSASVGSASVGSASARSASVGSASPQTMPTESPSIESPSTESPSAAPAAVGSGSVGSPGAAADDVERLASWLLRQAELG